MNYVGSQFRRRLNGRSDLEIDGLLKVIETLSIFILLLVGVKGLKEFMLLSLSG